MLYGKDSSSKYRHTLTLRNEAKKSTMERTVPSDAKEIFNRKPYSIANNNKKKEQPGT